MNSKTSLLLYFFGLITILSCKNDDDGVINSNTTSTGSVSSVKTVGGSKNDSAQEIVSTSDGGYAILGFTQSIDGDIIDKQNENFDFWVLKFNEENDIQWNKTYGGTGDDKGQDIIQTSDGGYAIIGSSFSNDEDVSGNHGQNDYWLAKLDASGNISWQKSYGYQGADYGISVIQTNDSGYLITGVLDVTASGGAGNTSKQRSNHAGGDYWALKLDASGTIEWSKYYGGLFTDSPESIVQTEDNGFIIVGGSDSMDTDISNNIGSYDFWVLKISATGAIVWEKSYGGEEIDEAWSIVKSGDGNYIIAGDTRSNTVNVSNNIGAADVWLIKISPTGELLWEKTIGGTGFDVARDISATQDGGFLLAGSSRSNDVDVSENKGQNDAWAVKVDSNGNIEWETSIGGTNIDFAYGITELNNKKVVVIGDTTSDDEDIIENKGFTDLLIVHID
ncbi:hypothetical protein [Lacinutrix jangbogonensis]|uniref:hypothetical protein n=1 Tax=Lacinutrix jangbogonensis TaxID=1469557 RepID=UPI0006924F41|nr:hypothetical protein [Lacinutrix jangbogonensis]